MNKKKKTKKNKNNVKLNVIQETTTGTKNKENSLKNNRYFCVYIFASILLFIVAVVIVSILVFKDKKVYTIKLKTNVHETYEWKYEIENKKIVKFEKKERYGDLEDKNGGNITEEFTFKALKPGKTKINFTFFNKYNKTFGEIKYYEAIVDNDMKLTIKKKKNSS